MSVESEILRIQHNIADTYATVSSKGGDVPLQPNSANLAAAVASIPAGGSTFLIKAPVGTIVIWSGTADNIPAGWQLCDGTNGTPDLRDKFVLGAGTNHTVGDTGGSEEVTLTVAQMPEHTHAQSLNNNGTVWSECYQTGSYLNCGYRSSSVISGNKDYMLYTGAVGSSQPHPNMPPYYALCYIMKLTADETDGVTMDQVNSAIDTKLDAYEPQEVYSTEEVRIGTWIDGKPLYRKVMSVITPGAVDQWVVVASISNANIRTLQAYLVDKFESSVFVPFSEDSTGICLYTKPGVVYIKFFGPNASYYTTRPITLILEYTKTTDQAQTASANTVLKAPSKAPALNSIQSAAATASGAEEIEI